MRHAARRDCVRSAARAGSRPQDAVLVGGARLVGDDVGAELDDAPERAVLDLDLLVEAPLGLLRAALAGDQQLAAADLERDSSISTPARSAFTTARGGSPA